MFDPTSHSHATRIRRCEPHEFQTLLARLVNSENPNETTGQNHSLSSARVCRHIQAGRQQCVFKT